MKSSAFAFLALNLLPAPAPADVFLLDAIAQEPPNTPEGVLRPVNGTTADEVLARFGEPTRRIAPVGDPPIGRWVYDAFTAYFERDRVIVSVVQR